MPGGVNGDEVIRHVGKRRVRISGRFFPQGAGALVDSGATARQGRAGWTVARTSAGLYTLTTALRFLKLLPAGVTLQQVAAGVPRLVAFGTMVINAAGTHDVQIRVTDATGAVQDLAADPNTSICFELEAVQDTVIG